MILPLNDFVGNSTGENLFWAKCREFLPSNYVSFHNYYLDLKQVDNILLVPGKGVLIIEIKGFFAKTILDAPSNNTIRRTDGKPPIPSPLGQANGYRYQFINGFLTPNEIDSVYVVSAVCYPFINESEYLEKHLDRISPRTYTILKEDLSSKDAFLQRILDIFDLAYNTIRIPTLKKDGFSPELLDAVGNLISRDFRDVEPLPEPSVPKPTGEEETALPPLAEEDYSVLVYSCDGGEFSADAITKYVADWQSGTKLQLFTSCPETVEALATSFQAAIASMRVSTLHKDSAESFQLSNGNLPFRLEIGLVKEKQNSFVIKNGELLSDHEADLRWLDNNSSFNYGQYCMEHAPLENIIVKAGAGTGKTFSLISRINYLIWKEKITPAELPSQIAMITFTNDSANKMKEDLTKNFLNFFHLTEDSRYLEYIDAIEDTRISTIDSLARAILSKYSLKLGLGINFRIVTGTNERSLLLRQVLNDYLTSNPDAAAGIPMTMFHFEQRLKELINKLDSKNVDLANDYASLEFGGGAKKLPDGIIRALKDVQYQLQSDMMDNNAVCLGDLIRKLRQLTNVLEESDVNNGIRIKYLFVDEFQDTDDVQIDLIHRFQKIIGFKYFVVGDTKQCIYRFRGAEDRAFETLKNLDKTATVYELSLRKNYRTDTGLLERMNRVFRAWNEDKDLEYQGDDVLIGTKEYTESPIYELLPSDDLRKDESNLISIIRNAQELVGKDGKVAILVRFNAQVKAVQEICARNGISVSTAVGGDLFSADPTIDLYKLLMALRYNQSPAHLYNLYTTSYVSKSLPKKSLLGCGSDELIRKFYENPPISKWDSYLAMLRVDPVLKVLQTIIQDVMPWEVFSNSSSKDPEEQKRNRLYYTRNLDQLFENLLKISNTEYLTLNKLSDYLELMILTRQEADAREPFGIDAANGSLICTTVHKSKGLQYDAVILPFCDFDITCKRDRGFADLIYSGNEIGYRILSPDRREAFVNDIYLKYQRDERACRQREETRILYVAMTRTKRAIYCIMPTKPPRNPTWSSKLKEELI